MKKILTSVLVNILWPILKQVLADLCSTLVKTAGATYKDNLEKKRARDKDSATTPEQKAEVDRRYDERVKDADEMVEKMAESVSKVVDQALKNAEGKRDFLISGTGANTPAPQIKGR